MQIACSCPGWSAPLRANVTPEQPEVRCSCGWSRIVPKERASEAPSACIACECADLWRQKDFPPQLGLALVAAGAILSTIAWANHMPVLTIGILLAFAGGDFLLYMFMPDVLVCYRCGARHRRTAIDDEHPRFNLETAERYRQQRIRLADPANSRR